MIMMAEGFDPLTDLCNKEYSLLEDHHFMFARSRLVVGLSVAMLTAAFTLALPLAAAQAHAGYKSSNPAPNSVLTKAPALVRITFEQNLDTKGLSITVYDNVGKVVSTGAAQIVTGKPDTASVAMAGDGSDIYRVDWTTVSAQDGDPTLGAFVFGVDPSGKTDKVPPTPTTTITKTTGVPTLLAVLFGIIGLAVGYGVAVALQRRQSA